jgi:hypothetical protein
LENEKWLNNFEKVHMTATYSGVDGYVGNTPFIGLRRVSELTGCEILGKAEFIDPARLRETAFT